MENQTANFFIIPISLGSAILFWLISFSDQIESDIEYYYQIHLLLSISFIYFFTDFILMTIRNKKGYSVYFVHHLVGMISVIVVHHSFHYAKYVIAYLMFELSTPFLNICLENQKKGIHNGYTILIELLFFISFTLVRIVFGTWLTHHLVLFLWESNPILIVLPAAIQLLNYWWYFRILRIMLRKILIGSH